MVRIIRSAIFLVLVLYGHLFAFVKVAEGQDRALQGFVEILDERGNFVEAAAGVTVTIVETQGSDVANTNGFFRISLPDVFRSGDEVELRVAKPGYVIYEPRGGVARIPANLERDQIKVQLMKRGAPPLLSPEAIVSLIEDFSNNTREQTRQEPLQQEPLQQEPLQQEPNLSRFIKDWAVKYGFSVEEVQAEVSRWVQSDQETGPSGRQSFLALAAEQGLTPEQIYEIIRPFLEQLLSAVSNLQWTPHAPEEKKEVLVVARVSDSVENITEVFINWRLDSLVQARIPMFDIGENAYEGTFPPLPSGSTVEFEVKVVDANERTGHTKTQRYTVRPSAPTTLRGQRRDGHVRLHWSPVAGASTYSIYRSDVSPTQNLYISGVKDTVYTDTNVSQKMYYRITADNAGGRSNYSNEVNVNVGIPDFIQGKYYALVIGISQYSGVWEPLPNPVDDARAVAELLRSEYWFEKVDTLYDQAATRSRIINRLEALEDSLAIDDHVLIYYSGHGYYHDGRQRGYWVPADATTLSSAEYISNADLRDIINSIPAKHVLLVSDACFAGDIFKGQQDPEDTDPEDDEDYPEQIYAKRSRKAMTSGSIEPVTDRELGEHSIFAHYFLKALRDNHEKLMRACRLFQDKIQTPVENRTGQSPLCLPIEGTGHEGGEFLFIRRMD